MIPFWETAEFWLGAGFGVLVFVAFVLVIVATVGGYGDHRD